MIHKGVAEMESLLDDAKKNGGGVIFVDETYQLISDRMGKQVLDFILPLAEALDGKYGKLVWVFAGYKTDMDKLFEHNPGIPSRFPLQFVFKDYSDEELFVDGANGEVFAGTFVGCAAGEGRELEGRCDGWLVG